MSGRLNVDEILSLSWDPRLRDRLTGIREVRGRLGGCGGVIGILSTLPRVLCMKNNHLCTLYIIWKCIYLKSIHLYILLYIFNQ